MYYQNEFLAAFQLLESLLAEDSLTELECLEEQKCSALFKHLVTVYSGYALLYQSLLDCYEMIPHPQKAQDVLETLEAVMARLVELRLEHFAMSADQMSTYAETLIEHNLTPEDILLPTPAILCAKRRQHLQTTNNELEIRRAKAAAQRKETLRTTTSTSDDVEAAIDVAPMKSTETAESESASSRPETSVTKAESEEDRLGLNDAILLIQKVERVRQAKAHVEYLKRLKLKHDSSTKQKITPESASVTIQKMIRGFLTRKHMTREREMDLDFLRMTGNELQHDFNDIQVAKQQRDKLKNTWQADADKEQLGMMKEMASSVNSMESDSRAQMKEYLQLYKAHYGSEAPLQMPDDIELALRELKQTMQEKKNRNVGLNRTSNGVQNRRGRQVSRGRTRQPNTKEPPEVLPQLVKIPLRPSLLIQVLNNQLTTHKETWLTKDESQNVLQKHDPSVMHRRLLEALRRKVRQDVEKSIRDEEQKVQKEKDINTDGRARKKKIKPRMKKQELTSDEQQKQLRDALYFFFQQNMLELDHQQPPNVLVSHRALFHLNGSRMVGDLYTIVTELLIFPLISDFVCTKVRRLKTVLMTAPVGCGKSSLIHAVSYTVGANLIHIASANARRATEDSKAFAEKIIKMCKYDTPTIIWFDNMGSSFSKAQQKGSKVRKLLRQLEQKLPTETRTLILVTDVSSQGINFDQFDLIIEIPKPSHKARYALLQKILTTVLKKYGLHIPLSLEFLSRLTNASNDLTYQQLTDGINNVFTDAYIDSLKMGGNLKESEFRKAFQYQLRIMPTAYDKVSRLKQN